MLNIVNGFQDSKEFFNGWRCFNVVIGKAPDADLDLLFGPFESDLDVILRLEEKDWGSLLKTLGVFPSATQARKNGWGKGIEVGWSEARFKKQRLVIFVWRADD